MKIRLLLLLCLLLGAPAPTYPQPAEEARHEVVNYNSQQSGVLPLYAWPGRRVVVLTSNGRLDEPVMKSIVEALDKAWEFMADATGREPVRDARTTWHGLAIVAVVPNACGDVCGVEAHAGIEVRADAWEEFYNGVRDRKEFGSGIFYHMSRAFWFYSQHTNGVDSIASGFAVWGSHASMDAAGVKATPINGHAFEDFRKAMEPLADAYLADAGLNFVNTILENKAPANPLGLGANDLFAAFVIRLLRSGDREFRRQFWREMALRPRARTREESADNLFLAASAAWGESQAALFEHWRWPVSEGAKSEAEAMFTLQALGGDGLNAEYWRGDFEQLLRQRLDPILNFEWLDGPPFEDGPRDRFCARWSGFVMAREAGKYTFSINVDDGTRLWVDGKLLVDEWSYHIGESPVAEGADQGRVPRGGRRRAAQADVVRPTPEPPDHPAGQPVLGVEDTARHKYLRRPDETRLHVT